MFEIKPIFEKEKYIDLILEADPDKEIVKSILKMEKCMDYLKMRKY